MMNNYYGIEFESGNKLYVFYSTEEIKNGTEVVVETEKGLQIGVVRKRQENFKKTFELKKIIRIATEEDQGSAKENTKEAKKAMEICKTFITELSLNMELVSSSYSLDKKTLLFTFISSERVDFRELLKKLSFKFKTRIELFQIGPRDRAKSVGGLGVCGEKLCCQRFLTKGESVSITSAKNQDLSLNPNKINGRCGLLLCCLNYENDTYCEYRKSLPNVDDKVEYKKKKCIVKQVNVLKNEYVLRCGEEEVIVQNE